MKRFAKHCLLLVLLFQGISLSPSPASADLVTDTRRFNQEAQSAIASKPLPSESTLRQWIAEMKQNPRGPFKRLRWFCNDGAVLPPHPYACADHGGGVQHGEWSDRVTRLRAYGYFIANVLADLDAAHFTQTPQWQDRLKQILLENFLIAADDGWIFRGARFYPGALQQENENASGRELLLDLVSDRSLRGENFLVLREAARLIPHGRRGASLTEMRQLASTIESKDPGFTPFRIKLHIRPDPGDAAKIRTYGAEKGKPEMAEDYLRLAALVDEIYQPRDLAGELKRLASSSDDAVLSRSLSRAAGQLAAEKDLPRRFVLLAEAMEAVRGRLVRTGSPSQLLHLLDLSLDLEREAYRTGNRWLSRLPETDRRVRLDWLGSGCRVLFGIGLISRRQLGALEESLATLRKSPLPARTYKRELDYLGRISAWAENTLHFQFQENIDRLKRLDPLFRLYLRDRLRGSPLVCQMAVLDSLERDAGRLVGLRNRVLGEEVTDELRALNPGLARGPLRFHRPGEPWRKEAIYLLPETFSDLPPVAGILTEGPGNALSHIQLLARNFGIPNAAVDSGLARKLAPLEGQRVVLAVSPAGLVELSRDGPRWDGFFRRERNGPDILIHPDLSKLDLESRAFIPLQNLRAADAGRIVGPKAANLGELKALYPDYVTEGLALPFGVFRAYLDQPIAPGGPSVFQWMENCYAILRRVANPSLRSAETSLVLRRLRTWLGTSEPGRELRQKLWGALFHAFGRDGSYGVFVRSDTNVEDLPGFSGAGLNRTVPNVVGFENILKAILQVWASPFTERAYRWRQARMAHPEQVYVSVLLLKSVPADKSGVMVTTNVGTGDPRMLTVAVNEGVGGAVAGQRAEELLIGRVDGKMRLLAQAAEPRKRVLLPAGGVAEVPASGERILSQKEITTLVRLADSLSRRFPHLVDSSGRTAPADIEFGFAGGRLALFQIRPFLKSPRARRNRYLRRLDEGFARTGAVTVDLQKVPREGGS